MKCQLSPSPVLKDSFRVGRGHGPEKVRLQVKVIKSERPSGGGVRPVLKAADAAAKECAKKACKCNRNKYASINVSALNDFEDGAVVDTDAIVKAGLLKDFGRVTILGNVS
jgi:large subunit ribosomal protein L15